VDRPVEQGLLRCCRLDSGLSMTPARSNSMQGDVQCLLWRHGELFGTLCHDVFVLHVKVEDITEMCACMKHTACFSQT